jgi:hypothetical protein
MKQASEALIEQAFDEGSILRTHVMRPTWHFVTPADIRWLLKLTAPRVHAVSQYAYRKTGVDDVVSKRTKQLFTRALRGGKQLTRAELAKVCERGGIEPGDSVRFGYILIRAELDGLICSGARRGKQFTYALLEERAPQTNGLSRDEALAELTRRYFTSHGPATLPDFVWWSGLATADVRRGLEIVKSELTEEVIGKKTYWRSTASPIKKLSTQVAYLLPLYDEYLISYKDRSDSLLPGLGEGNIVEKLSFQSPLVISGQVTGGWKRTLNRTEVAIEIKSFRTLSRSDKKAINEATHRYSDFMGLPVSVELIT